MFEDVAQFEGANVAGFFEVQGLECPFQGAPLETKLFEDEDLQLAEVLVLLDCFVVLFHVAFPLLNVLVEFEILHRIMPKVKALAPMYRLANPVREISARQLDFRVVRNQHLAVVLRVVDHLLFHEFFEVDHVDLVFVAEEAENVGRLDEAVLVVVDVEEGLADGDPERCELALDQGVED